MKTQIYTIAYFDINQKNGGAIFAKNMDRFLNQSDFFQSIVYCNNRRSFINETKITDPTNFFVSRFLMDNIRNQLINNKFFELLVYFLRKDLNAFFLVLKLFLKRKIKSDSIILCHDHLSLFYFSLFYSLKKYKVVMVMHNDGSPSAMITCGLRTQFKIKILNKIINYQIKSTVSDINKIIFLCDLARNKFIELYNINFDKTAIIPNGINSNLIVNNIKTELSTIKFICVCTMNKRKGIDTFIKCLPIINNQYQSKINFTLIGKGPLLEDLKQLSLKYKNLNVLGESNKVTEYLSRSDVFFLLSKNEGQPLSILEALRASLFVLATNVGCNSSMVTEQNGLLVNTCEESILEGFSNIISNWSNFRSKGQNSLQLFNDSFTEVKMFRAYYLIFKELL